MGASWSVFGAIGVPCDRLRLRRLLPPLRGKDGMGGDSRWSGRFHPPPLPSPARGEGARVAWVPRPMIDFINFYLVPGLVQGSIYAMGAIGVSMLFGILRFANFAHGDLATLGGFFALVVVTYLGLPPVAALPFAMAGVAVVAIGLDRAFYKPFRAAPSIVLVMASFGGALMLRSAIQIIWGPEAVAYQRGICTIVRGWRLQNLPESIVAENFPHTPTKAARELRGWLMREITSLFDDEEELPNA